ncbi:uncharacterized protein LOC126577019 [Anopheles aquasalis]|uniref:uncharacterized protein LOC126577019 n=1 Tax=Anopheles aquasalis TaxID=42839 RepID=UPI00215AFAE3|nr:uncharacterized protein LOC126577019 [Anopheles aquasalis]
MTTTRDLIEEKLLVCDQIRKRKDLLTDEEYQILKECRTSELFRVESNTQRLGKICEGEKRQLAAFYDQQDAKYRRAVTKINRRVLPKPRDAVPPPRPIVRPTGTSPPVSTTQDTTVIRLTGATRSTGMGMDAAIDTRAAVSPVTPAPDIYQLEEQIPVSVIRSEHELMLEALEDDNFGNAQGDGMRDFLEMCTGTELPPMELGDESSQKLLLSQLPSMQHPTLPAVDNFQELNIDAVLSQLDLPGPTGPPNAPTPPQLIPPLPFEAFGEDGLDNAQQLPPAFESVPVVQSPLLEAPSERSQYVPAEAPVLPEPVEEAVPPRRGVRRQPRTFTNRLPLLEDLFGLPRNRNTFDIFSCYYDSNVDWMIERLQNQLFEQRVASPLQPQPLLTTDLSAIRPNDSMSIDAQRRITGSGVAGNVSEWSRENPPPLSFADRTDPHGQSSNLHDAARARMTDALETPPVGVASIVAPESLPPLLSLPPLHDDPLPAQPHVVEQVKQVYRHF